MRLADAVGLVGQIRSKQETCRDAGFQEGKCIKDVVEVVGHL